MMKWSSSFLTLVVHVGGYLDITQADVHRQVVEVVVWHQDELLPQLQIVPFLISFIDEHSIEVFILQHKPTFPVHNTHPASKWGLNGLVHLSIHWLTSPAGTRNFYPLLDSFYTLRTGTFMKTELSIHLKKTPYSFSSLAALKILRQSKKRSNHKQYLYYF